MVSTPEQRRRYHKKYPEKVKEHKRRYLERKILKRIKENPAYLEKLKGKLLNEFDMLTRILYAESLRKRCEVCGTTEDLHIHHIRYKYPIEKKDLKILCRKHHTEEHQKLNPFPD